MYEEYQLPILIVAFIVVFILYYRRRRARIKNQWKQ